MSNPHSLKIYSILSPIKGGPITVLIALHFFGGLASPQDLETATGYNRASLVKYLSALEAMGLVQATPEYHHRYHLTSQVKQLELFEGDIIINIPMDQAQLEEGRPDQATQEMRDYLSSVGIWSSQIDRVAQALDQDLQKAQDYFYPGCNLKLMVHRALNGIPAGEPGPGRMEEEPNYTGGLFSDFIDH